MYMVGFKEDMLFRSDEMRLIADRLATRRTLRSNYLEVDSNYGHDAFLVELDKFDDYVTKALHE
jgi:homoserine O-acetyltransferase